MRKKSLYLLLGITTACMLAGCGDKKTDTTTSVNDGQVVESTDAVDNGTEDIDNNDVSDSDTSNATDGTGYHGIDAFDILDNGKCIVEVDAKDVEMDLVHGTHDFKLFEFSYNGTATNMEDCYDVLVANGWSGQAAVFALDGADACITDGINAGVRVQDSMTHPSCTVLGTHCTMTFVNNSGSTLSPQDSFISEFSVHKPTTEDDANMPFVFVSDLTWNSTEADIIRTYGTPTKINHYAEGFSDAHTTYKYEYEYDLEFEITVDDATKKITDISLTKDHDEYFPIEEIEVSDEEASQIGETLEKFYCNGHEIKSKDLVNLLITNGWEVLEGYDIVDINTVEVEPQSTNMVSFLKGFEGMDTKASITVFFANNTDETKLALDCEVSSLMAGFNYGSELAFTLKDGFNNTGTLDSLYAIYGEPSQIIDDANTVDNNISYIWESGNVTLTVYWNKEAQAFTSFIIEKSVIEYDFGF